MNNNNKSNEDCYYFLYSNCLKGEECLFRHNILAKQCNVICSAWADDKDCREDCPFRHSYYHINKQRSEDWCYWETHGGCLKKYCEFKHQNHEKDSWKNTTIKNIELIKEEKNSSLQLDNSIENINRLNSEKIHNHKKSSSSRKVFHPERINIFQLKKTASNIKGEEKITINLKINELRKSIIEIYNIINKNSKYKEETDDMLFSEEKDVDKLLNEIDE